MGIERQALEERIAAMPNEQRDRRLADSPHFLLCFFLLLAKMVWTLDALTGGEEEETNASQHQQAPPTLSPAQHPQHPQAKWKILAGLVISRAEMSVWRYSCFSQSHQITSITSHGRIAGETFDFLFLGFCRPPLPRDQRLPLRGDWLYCVHAYSQAFTSVPRVLHTCSGCTLNESMAVRPLAVWRRACAPASNSGKASE